MHGKDMKPPQVEPMACRVKLASTDYRETPIMPDYAEWIAAQRRDAEERGGKPLRNHSLLSGSDDPNAPAKERRPASDPRVEWKERLNGECLTISRLAKKHGLSAQKTAKLLEELDCVVSVLRVKFVPMVCDPTQNKPQYYHSPAITRFGREEGLALQVLVRGPRKLLPCILITPRGQAAFSRLLADKAATPKLGKVAKKRETISRLLAEGRTQAAIVRTMGLPKQTVSRIVKTIANQNALVPF